MCIQTEFQIDNKNISQGLSHIWWNIYWKCQKMPEDENYMENLNEELRVVGGKKKSPKLF